MTTPFYSLEQLDAMFRIEQDWGVKGMLASLDSNWRKKIRIFIFAMWILNQQTALAPHAKVLRLEENGHMG